MNDLDASAFIHLFKNAYVQCFGHALQTPLSETESRQFSNHIFEETGLTIGWKSLKNYSFYALNDPAGKKENPSVATLDTLARYVLKAPYTDELQRKNKESHHPWWFRYKEQFYQQTAMPPPAPPVRRKRSFKTVIIAAAVLVCILILFISLYRLGPAKAASFTEDFHTVNEDSLRHHGWVVQMKDEAYWNRRAGQTGGLTLFTLPGDNWPDSGNVTGIKNLLLHKIDADCFTAEVHMNGFVPVENWQQAGLILLEDTAFTGKSLRLSVAYNDFSAGAPVNREILIQAITSPGSGFTKPEEVAHKDLFRVGQDADDLIKNNMANTALRIEKQGDHLRLLYANGPLENSAFKEVVNLQFDIRPAWIGLFALKGFVKDGRYAPACFTLFKLAESQCAN
jgi:hypothetical protein